MTKQFLFAATVTSMIAAGASASLVAGWTIPTPVPAGSVSGSYVYGAADVGDAVAGTMLLGVHASLAAAYSSPAGNGSSYSLSSNNWTLGDYYQISFSTLGVEAVDVTWDQTRSGTGPSSFSVLMSIDGGVNWTTSLASYSVLQAGSAGSGTTSWNTVTNQPGFFTTTVALGETASNQQQVLVRFSSLVTTAAAGTSRIDNIMVNAVPAPGAIALLGLACIAARRRR